LSRGIVKHEIEKKRKRERKKKLEEHHHGAVREGVFAGFENRLQTNGKIVEVVRRQSTGIEEDVHFHGAED
tara:strand:+ start:107 stop:319 length:213 start_codon:yes stop_codon:yes gene_type:complete